jgi:repressor LexA
MQPRTKRQREVLDYVTQFIEQHGYEPSYQQIARRFRIASKSAIAKHIAALENQGFLLRVRENGSFNLQLRSKTSVAAAVCEIHWLTLPKVESFEESWEQSPLLVSRFLLGGILLPERVRAFRVRDDSMIDDHICEGDVALIEERSFARDGDCVVALIENEQVALKRFYRVGANIELRPANRDYEVRRLSAEKVLIKGVFRALFRPLN